MTKPSRHLRIGVILLAWTLCMGWIFATFFLNDVFDDPHGYGGVVWCGVTSIGLALLGVVLVATALALHPLSSRSFAAAVLFAPVAHLAGATINAPDCNLFFVLPSVAIMILGIRDAVIVAQSHALGV
jgi:hypothetical protein